MTIVIDLPQHLESKLSAEALRHGMPLQEYLLLVLANGGQAPAKFNTGAELLAYWQQSDVIGSRTDIDDSQRHARELRAEVEHRERQ